MISERMRLIKDDRRTISVFLGRKIHMPNKEKGNYEIVDGENVWRSYVSLLKDDQMDYAKKKVLLSDVKSQMTYFIYQIPNTSLIPFNEQIGEIYYLQDGEQYFENGKFQPEKLINPNESFIKLGG